MFRRPALPLSHPACLIATWFGSGLAAKAPGTWGSVAALPCAVVLVWLGGSWALAIAVVAAFLAGLWASARYTAAGDAKDPGAVVIDEVAGQWLTLIPVALDLRYYLLGFLLFRLFDIWKPWPIGWLDRNVEGAPGIMIDDIVAGAYAGTLCFIASQVWGLEATF
ncbi:MAG: phosphatidylglycerophosphatase A [Pseudomonadota bacterium]